ncbi:MAG: hypothetical protein WC756_03755 [Taibaiella sp.]|jgi:hypothetical protein
MSWIDKIKTELTITCGDGKSFSPNWISASKSIEYNLATFEFKGLPGTLVYRGTPRGTRYQLQLFFQGENHLDLAEEFLESSADSRPWKVSHPLYGNLLVQPTALTIGNEEYNVSSVSGLVIETIPLVAATQSNISPLEKIYEVKINTDIAFDRSFATQIPSINAVDTLTMSGNIGNSFASVVQKITDSKWKDQYLNAMNKANAALNNPLFDTISTMQAVREFTTMPYQFSDDVITRLNMFVSQFTLLSGTVVNLFSRSSKKIYENNAGITISGMMLSAVTGIGTSYDNAIDVLNVIDQLVLSYNEYIENLDRLQSENGGSPDSFIPDADAVGELSYLTSLTINTLLDIAADGKQQRTVYLAEDTNLILVAHKLYGYTADDSIFDKMIKNNNISNRELLMLQKGRRIVYFI